MLFFPKTVTHFRQIAKSLKPGILTRLVILVLSDPSFAALVTKRVFLSNNLLVSSGMNFNEYSHACYWIMGNEKTKDILKGVAQFRLDYLPRVSRPYFIFLEKDNGFRITDGNLNFSRTVAYENLVKFQ